MIRSMIRNFFLSPVLRAIHHLERNLMSKLDTLTNEVSQATTVMASAAVLLAGLKTQLDDAIAKLNDGDDGAALEALSTQLDTGANALAAAVEANTPVAAPAPAPAPAPGEDPVL